MDLPIRSVRRSHYDLTRVRRSGNSRVLDGHRKALDRKRLIAVPLIAGIERSRKPVTHQVQPQHPSARSPCRKIAHMRRASRIIVWLSPAIMRPTRRIGGAAQGQRRYIRMPRQYPSGMNWMVPCHDQKGWDIWAGYVGHFDADRHPCLPTLCCQHIIAGQGLRAAPRAQTRKLQRMLKMPMANESHSTAGRNRELRPVNSLMAISEARGKAKDQIIAAHDHLVQQMPRAAAAASPRAHPDHADSTQPHRHRQSKVRAPTMIITGISRPK